VIVGGVPYSNRSSAVARRFVNRHLGELRMVPVWFFSRGPLSDAAEREAIPATAQVAVLAERVGAKGHVTFGGRLAPDARGFPASAMAKKKAGDWRNPERIRAWAAELAAASPGLRPAIRSSTLHVPSGASSATPSQAGPSAPPPWLPCFTS
jgi:menaquinone-dependent protoporphyrinogen oxidase